MARIVLFTDTDVLTDWHGELDVTDRPGVFWSSLTPSQILELLKIAPRVAGPWIYDEDGGAERVGDDGLTLVYACLDWNGEGPVWTSDRFRQSGKAASFEAARDAADVAMRTAGWLLV